MSTRRTKGDSSATATRRRTRRRDEVLREEDSDSATTLGSETGMADETPASENESEPAQPTNAFTFGSFTTPDLESVSKELEGTKKEPLATVAASHPTDMKGAILDHGGKMIDLFLGLRQKSILGRNRWARPTMERHTYPAHCEMEIPLQFPSI